MYIRVKVLPKAKKEKIEIAGQSRYNISVKEPAEKNMANNRMLEVLAKEIDKSPKELRIISGHHSPIKLISVRD